MSLDLDRIRQRSRFSMIGGPARPRQEREGMDLPNEERQEEDNPSGAGGSARKGMSGGTANDNRSDPGRSPASLKG